MGPKIVMNFIFAKCYLAYKNCFCIPYSEVFGCHLPEDIQTELSRGYGQTLEIYDILSGYKHKQLLKLSRQVLNQYLCLWPEGVMVLTWQQKRIRAVYWAISATQVILQD